MRRMIMLFSVVPLLLAALGAGPAAASIAGSGSWSGSSLTITALSPDTTTPYSNTQDTIYIQLSANAPSGGTVVTTTSSNQSAMPIPASITVAAGASVGQVDFTAGNVSTPTQATFTAAIGSWPPSADEPLRPAARVIDRRPDCLG